MQVTDSSQSGVEGLSTDGVRRSVPHPYIVTDILTRTFLLLKYFLQCCSSLRSGGDPSLSGRRPSHSDTLEHFSKIRIITNTPPISLKHSHREVKYFLTFPVSCYAVIPGRARTGQYQIQTSLAALAAAALLPSSSDDPQLPAASPPVAVSYQGVQIVRYQTSSLAKHQNSFIINTTFTASV